MTVGWESVVITACRCLSLQICFSSLYPTSERLHHQLGDKQAVSNHNKLENNCSNTLAYVEHCSWKPAHCGTASKAILLHSSKEFVHAL